MKALILTGGKETRIAPYTTVLPKPLMPIEDVPILGITLRHIKHFGFSKVIIKCGYLAELIQKIKILMLLLIVGALVICLPLTTKATELSGRVYHVNTPVPKAFVVSIDHKNRMKFAFTDQQGRYTLKVKEAPFYLVSVIPIGNGIRNGFTFYNYMQQNRLIYPEQRKQILLDYHLERAGNLVLVAYDKQGRLMRKKNFMKQGHFGEQFIYATDLDGEATASLPTFVHDQAGRDKDNPDEMGIPVMLIPLKKPVAVHFLFWEVKNAGKLLLEMNPDGKGYQFTSKGELKAILVNHALAVTQFQKLRRRLEGIGDTNIKGKVQADIRQVENLLVQAEKVASQKEKARISDEALSRIIRIREDVELLKAHQDIEQNRKGSISIFLKHKNGTPLTGASIAYKQTSHDYLFGVSEIGAPAILRKCKEIGINHTPFMPIMGAIQPEPNTYRFNAVDDNFNLNLLFQEKLHIKAHGMMYFFKDFIPQFYFGRPFKDIRSNLEEHLKRVILRYRDNVDIWEAVNEPSTTNPLGFSREQMLEVIKMSCKAIHKYAPGKKILINDAGEFDFGLKYLIYNESGNLQNTYSTSFNHFLQALTRQGNISYDIIGLQFYPGFYLGGQFENLRGPAMDLGWYSDYLDQYAKYGKEIHLTEFSVPSKKGDGMNGWWRRPWDSETQAEYLLSIYTITFSKPDVKAITWWNASDKGAFIVSGGLLDSKGREKPAFSALRNLLSQWTSRGVGKTDGTGRLHIGGFGGTYQATVNSGGSTRQITFSITERKDRKIDVIVP